MSKRSSWRSRLGFYLVAIGSALGLGNMWRFPYVVGENGGGAFIFLYVTIAIAIGAPLLIAELILGKSYREPVLLVTEQLGKRVGSYGKWVGRLTFLSGVIVLSYYSVISGWVLHFLTQFFVAATGIHDFSSSLKLETLTSSGWLQYLLSSAHILIILILVSKGVQEGLEKWMTTIMPFYALIILAILIKTISLTSYAEAVRFIFYPDFSKLTYSSLGHAIGHVFFTLSVGFGTIITYGTYLREEDHVPSMGFRVAIADTIFSLIAALIIFPIVFQASSTSSMSDPSLLFEVLPQFFVNTESGKIFGFIFFLGLYLAALNASVGMLEMIVSNVKSYLHRVDRTQAGYLSVVLVLVVTIFPALSTNVLKSWQFKNLSLIEFLDKALINWILPLSALGFSILFYRSISESEKEKHFVNQQMLVSVAMYSIWKKMIKWVIPTMIILGLALQAVDLYLKMRYTWQ